MMRVSLRAKAGSPGLGVSDLPSSRSACTEGGATMPVAPQHGLGVRERRRVGRRRTGGDHRRVVARHVGNDQATRSWPARPRRASRPPLIAERCLRTQLISLMFAPLLSSALFKACLSSSVIPGAGRESKAEPPPDIRQSARSSGPRPLTRSRILRAAVLPCGVGNGMGGLDDLDPLQRADAVAIARDDQA